MNFWVRELSEQGVQLGIEKVRSVGTSDVIFRKMTNRNQTDTNEMTNTEAKYQTNFILPQNTNI